MILVAGDVMLDVMLLSSLRAEEQSRGIIVRGGGSAANTAAWLAHLGHLVTFVGCVGHDEVGRMLTHELAMVGVHTDVRRVRGAETGAVAVEIGDGGERLMRSARGANEALSPDDLRRAAAAELSVVHITGYALIGPHGLDMLTAAAEVARGAGAKLSFDPSSRGVIERVGAEAMLAALERCHVDILLPNSEEAHALTGYTTADEAAVALAEVVPFVIVKDANAGAAWSDGRKVETVTTTSLHPVDSTGAGDAFNAGALAALAWGRSLADACLVANEVAAVTIHNYGGRPPSAIDSVG